MHMRAACFAQTICFVIRPFQSKKDLYSKIFAHAGIRTQDRQFYVSWFMGSQRVGHDWVTELTELTDKGKESEK